MGEGRIGVENAANTVSATLDASICACLRRRFSEAEIKKKICYPLIFLSVFFKYAEL